MGLLVPNLLNVKFYAAGLITLLREIFPSTKIREICKFLVDWLSRMKKFQDYRVDKFREM